MTTKSTLPGFVPYYTAQESARAVQKFNTDQIHAQKGALRWGLPSLDAPDIPARYPGCIYVVQARSFHGKSLFANHVLRQDVEQLKKRDKSGELIDVSLNVKLEETVEQVTVQYWNDPAVRFRQIVSGRGNAEAINRAAIQHGGDPFVLVGFAAGRDAVLPPNVITRSRVSVDDLHDIVRRLLESNRMRVVSVILDMINRVHDQQGGRSLPERISNISQDVMNFASSCGLPVVAFAQSVFKGENTTGFPEMDSIAGSSDICRDAEAVFSLYKPNRDRGVFAKRVGPAGQVLTPGTMITIDGREVECESWMLGLKVIKYRNTEVDPSTGVSIADRELLLKIHPGGRIEEMTLEHMEVAQ